MADKILNRVTAVATPANATETVILTSAAYLYDQPNPFVGGEHAGSGNGVKLSGIINITLGAGVTACVVRIRQGSLSGPVVGLAQTTAATASTNVTLPYEEFDTTRFPAQSGGGVWVVTLSTTGATGAGTVNVATLTSDGA